MARLSSVRLAAVTLSCCLLVVCGRVAWTGWAEYSEALAFEAEERWHEAAVRHGRTIHMYLPGSPLPRKAGDRLLALAEAATARGAVGEARFCYEELRSGFLSVRSFYQPGAHYIRAAEDGLVPLMLTDERGNWPNKQLSPAAREAAIRAVFTQREDPNLLWVLLMGVGYFVWLGAAGLGIWRGLPVAQDAPINWPVLGRYAGGSLAGYLLWLLAVWQA
jgi:hypothetical protein